MAGNVGLTYAVALKAPKLKGNKASSGRLVQCTSSSSSTWTFDPKMDIDGWVTTQLTKFNWTGWLLYNDEAPDRVTPESHGGHCKGILAWNDTTLGWMIHSVPKWPAVIGETIPLIPPAECEYGQSFAWLTLPVSRRDDVLAQIRIMQAHAYSVHGSFFDTYREPHPRHAAPPPARSFVVIQLSDVVSHVAKHSKWEKDLFQDGIVPYFGGAKWETETWSRPHPHPTKDVTGVKMVSWAKPAISYNQEQDHSKWAISLDKKKPWTYIGDINATSSQFHRGGGGVVIKDLNLWKAMSSLVSS